MYSCATCGYGFENGGVLECVLVTDLDPDNEGSVRTLRFCRDHEDSDGNKVKGCGRRLLSASKLKHHQETINAQ